MLKKNKTKKKKMKMKKFKPLNKSFNKNFRFFATHKVPRGNYAKLSENDLNFFEQILSKERIITDNKELEIYNFDWMKKYKGNSSVALFPSSTEQVSKILSYCNEKKLAVVPQGCSFEF